jgi:hypothetical protein
VNVDSPNKAVLREEIQLVIDVSNPTGDDIELGSIDLYNGLLDGFDVTSITPTPLNRENIFNFTSLSYDKTLSPSDNFTVTLTLLPTQVGVWSGDIDCCTPSENFVTSTQTIVVSELAN